MRVFTPRWFRQFSTKERISNVTLLDAIVRAESGKIDADLGGGVIKQRIARPGQGRSKGYRAIIFFKRGDRAFFIYGFAKKDQANITHDEQQQFREASKYVLALSGRRAVIRIACARRFHGDNT